MRWKEHFLVPDHRVRTITGASFEGFYYICFNQILGVVNGIYFHSKSERYAVCVLHNNFFWFLAGFLRTRMYPSEHHVVHPASPLFSFPVFPFLSCGLMLTSILNNADSNNSS